MLEHAEIVTAALVAVGCSAWLGGVAILTEPLSAPMPPVAWTLAEWLNDFGLVTPDNWNEPDNRPRQEAGTYG